VSWLTAAERTQLTALMDALVPGAGTAGGVDYVDQLLSAFDHDPPRIWLGGRGQWLELGAAEELAWRVRIEGSQGRPEREFNGPHTGWQQRYRDGLAAPDPDREFLDLVFRHACEALYGDPAYGGNRRRSGWTAIGFDGPTQPRGWTDAEVTTPVVT